MGPAIKYNKTNKIRTKATSWNDKNDQLFIHLPLSKQWIMLTCGMVHSASRGIHKNGPFS